ncbi:MAG: hypothetical protein IH991_19480, partial [Planctomycetes bacterium]|nr:hypothetical protein [Planctomycetota bacterium]
GLLAQVLGSGEPAVLFLGHDATGEQGLIAASRIAAATGVPFTTEDFVKIGERTWNIERLWNLKAGLTKADDSLPKRLLNESHKEGPSQGVTVNLDAMLPIYYAERGWDEEGIPSAEKLAELGLASL